MKVWNPSFALAVSRPVQGNHISFLHAFIPPHHASPVKHTSVFYPSRFLLVRGEISFKCKD